MINHLCFSSVATALGESTSVSGVVPAAEQALRTAENLVPHVQQEPGLDPAAEL